MAMGSMLIKERYQFFDEETVAHVTMNPYLQHFFDLEAFTQKFPFDASMMTRFWKRISARTLQEVDDIIIGKLKEKNDDDDKEGSGSGRNTGTKGALILDATCAPQNIRFPTDASLLNEARINAEAIIDVFHENGLTDCEKKSITYREKAKHQYDGFPRAGKRPGRA